MKQYYRAKAEEAERKRRSDSGQVLPEVKDEYEYSYVPAPTRRRSSSPEFVQELLDDSDDSGEEEKKKLESSASDLVDQDDEVVEAASAKRAEATHQDWYLPLRTQASNMNLSWLDQALRPPPPSSLTTLLLSSQRQLLAPIAQLLESGQCQFSFVKLSLDLQPPNTESDYWSTIETYEDPGGAMDRSCFSVSTKPGLLRIDATNCRNTIEPQLAHVRRRQLLSGCRIGRR